MKKRNEKMFDEDIFKDRLRAAIGDKKKVEFAELIGIAPQQLNSMLNNKNISVPTVKTLKKIAGVAENGITLKDLGEAVGYKDEALISGLFEPGASVKYRSDDARNEDAETEIFTELGKSVKNTKVYKTMDDFMSRVIKRCTNETYLYSVGEPQKCESGNENIEDSTAGVTMVFPIEVTWSTSFTASRLIFGLKAIVINGHKVVIDIVKEGKALHDMGLLTKETADILGKDFIETADSIHIVEDSTPDAENGLKNILLNVYQNEINGSYNYAYEGFGFKTAGISDVSFRKFIKKHNYAYRLDEKEKNLYSWFVEEEKDSEQLKDALKKKYGEDNTVVTCDYRGRIPCIMAAQIMSRELGVWADYFSDSWVGEDDKMDFDQDDVILVDEREYCDMSSAWIKKAMNKYAKELGLSRYGYQYYFEKRPLNFTDNLMVE